MQTSNFEGLSLKIENGLDVHGEPSVYYGIKESLLANTRRLGDQEIYIKRETVTPDDMHELQLENCNTLHYSLPCIEHIEIKVGSVAVILFENNHFCFTRKNLNKITMKMCESIG